MVGHRRKDLVKSRRRIDDGEEEEVGSDVAPLEDDSLSEATELSELEDEEGDADGSDISEQHDATDAKASPPKDKTTKNGSAAEPNGVATKPKSTNASPAKDGPVLAGTDTEIMMNGMQVPEGAVVEEIHFDDIQEEVAKEEAPSGESAPEAASTAQTTEPSQERRRRTQDEYRQKRDADPTFVPNRGGFFMHDHRHAGPGANGFRPFGKGRGRGRGVGGGMPSDRYVGSSPSPTASLFNRPTLLLRTTNTTDTDTPCRHRNRQASLGRTIYMTPWARTGQLPPEVQFPAARPSRRRQDINRPALRGPFPERPTSATSKSASSCRRCKIPSFSRRCP